MDVVFTKGICIIKLPKTETNKINIKSYKNPKEAGTAIKILWEFNKPVYHAFLLKILLETL